MTTQNLYEEWSTKLRQEGLNDGLQKGRLEGEREALTRLFVKRLGRPLTDGEQQTVAARHEKLGLSRLEDVALELPLLPGSPTSQGRDSSHGPEPVRHPRSDR